MKGLIQRLAVLPSAIRFSILSLVFIAGMPTAHAVIVAEDDFSSGNYSGGSGWSGNWLEEGQGCTDADCTEDTVSSHTSGVLRVINQELRMIGATGVDPTVKRTLNLTGYDTATLTFTREGVGGLDSNDTYEVCWSASPVGPFTDCVDYADDPVPNPSTETIDISAAISATTTIRYRINANIIGTPPNPTEQLRIDNVSIDAEAASTLEDDFAVTDLDQPVTIQVTNNDSDFVSGTICLENPLLPGTCLLTDRVIPGQGTFSVSGDDIVFTPVAGYAGPVTPINYLAVNSASVVQAAEIVVVINERALCDVDGSGIPFLLGTPGSAGGDELVAFQADDGSGTQTGESVLLLAHNDEAAANGVGQVSVINALAVDSTRNQAYYVDNSQTLSPDTLFMYDANTDTIYEVIGGNSPAGYPTSFNDLGISFCGTELGGAGGEFFGGSYYVGVEEHQGCTDADGYDFDQIYRIDFDFSVNPPLPVSATPIWEFDPANAGGVGSGTSHDWGDFLVYPDDPDGVPGSGDERILLVDFDRNSSATGPDYVTVLDVTDPDNVSLVEINAGGVDEFGQSAISYDNTVYVFAAADDAVQVYDVTATDGDGIGPEGNLLEIAGTAWPEGVSSADGSACVNPSGGLPVTLGYFNSRESGNRIHVRWQTLTETFTVGFNIWGQVNEDWLQLNDKLLTTKRLDSVVPQKYRARVSVRDLDGPVTALALTSVDLNGYEEGYGPFEPGQEYGAESEFEPVPWESIGSEYADRMADNGYAWINNRWRKLNKGRQKKLARAAERAEDLADIAVDEDGMVRVTYEDLFAAGIDMDGVREKTIALTWKGLPVPRHVTGKGNRFGPGSAIHFFGEAPKGDDALYVAENLYQLGLDEASALPVRKINRNPRAAEASYLATSRVEEDIAYANLLPTGDPFHMGIIVAGSGGGIFPAAASPALEIEVGSDIDLSAPAYVEVNLAAITDFPAQDISPADGEVDPDHAVSLLINGQVVLPDNGTFKGYGAWLVKGVVPAGVLVPGVNEIRIETLATGYGGTTLKALDHYAVHYVRSAEAVEDRIVIGEVNQVLGEGVDADGFEISGFSQKALVGYTYSNSADTHPGNLQRLHVRSRARNGGFVATVPTVGDDSAGYWVSTESAMNPPAAITPADDAHDLLSRTGDYILVVHPNFLPSNPGNHPLNDYLAAKEAEGYDPVVVDLDHIIDDFGFGMKTPDAITNYLRAADATFAYDHVLLVGGDVNDYLDRSGSGAISFIPTRYTVTGDLLRYSPSDALIVDFDGDDLSDKALGRWPVRTLAELETIVDKTLAFSSAATGLYDQRRALLIAEEITPQEGYDFSAQMERLNSSLQSFIDDPANPVQWDDTPDAVDRVYVQDLIDGGDPAPYVTARSMIYDGINAADGQTLTIFGGHGSPAAWSFNLLLQSSDVAANLANVGRPTLMMPMACYTTYYNETHTNTLAHQLLLSGEQGAAAIHAAATLSSYQHNEAMGRAILEYQLRDGDTLGMAVERARARVTDPDVRKNWTVLGDPTFRIQ